MVYNQVSYLAQLSGRVTLPTAGPIARYNKKANNKEMAE